MSKRIKPTRHLLGTLAWLVAAAAGLWPAVPGIADSSFNTPTTFLELVRLSNGWLGAIAVVGLAATLAALLHLLTALDLWIDERAMRRGGIQGNWRATRLGVATALALGTLVGAGWTAYHQLRVDVQGNYTAMVEDYSSRSGEAWRQFADIFKQERPSDRLQLPGAGQDPLPVLREMARSPVVAYPYHVSADGMLTLLTPKTVERFDLRTWQTPAQGPFWPKKPHPTAADFASMRFADLVETIGRSENRYTSARREAGFRPISMRPTDVILYAMGQPHEESLGFALNESFLQGQGRAILKELQLPASWWGGPIYGTPYLLPEPTDVSDSRLGPLHLVLELYQTNEETEAHIQNTCFVLAALILLFVASVVESVRQGRSLIAERAMQMAQSSFVSGVSHEMRTPLATVRLYTELLEQGLDETPAQRGEFLQAILLEVDRLHRLIENVLDFARISGRKRTYTFVPTELRGVIDEAIQAAKGPLTTAGLTCEVHMPATLSASIDRDAIVQALANLLANAAKYGASGGRVWITGMPRPGGVELAVQDFGPGIPRHEQVKVFHPFYRIAGQAVGGTGLGLALVTEYARAHGGHVSLESPPGEGATFSLHLPEDPSLASAQAPTRAGVAARDRLNALGAKIRCTVLPLLARRSS